MDYAKTQLLTDTFQFPKWGLKKKQKEATRAERSRKPKTPKDPKPKRVPLTPEDRKERQRVSFKKRLEEAKSLGLCSRCREPAIEGQTRCQECAERHRVRRREDDSKRRAAAKLSEEKPTQGPVAPASPEATAPQPDQQAEYRNARLVGEASTPTHPAEGERPGGSHPERKKTRREYKKKQREMLKASGLCKDCRGSAIPGQTRCEACAEKHRVRRRQNNATRRTKACAAGNADGGTQ